MAALGSRESTLPGTQVDDGGLERTPRHLTHETDFGRAVTQKLVTGQGFEGWRLARLYEISELLVVLLVLVQRGSDRRLVGDQNDSPTSTVAVRTP